MAQDASPVEEDFSKDWFTERLDLIQQKIPKPSDSSDSESDSSSQLPRRFQWVVESLKKSLNEPEQFSLKLAETSMLLDHTADLSDKPDYVQEFHQFFPDFRRRWQDGRVRDVVQERRSKMPIVRYLPCIPDFPPSEVNGPAPPDWLAMFVHSEIPSVCIEDYNACCNICLEDLEEPPLAMPDDGDDVDPMADDSGGRTSPKLLRQLPCRHVLHENCLPMFQSENYDEVFECPVCRTQVWAKLDEPSVSCPVCNNVVP
ncbi:hypothetical protein D9758_007534 [Tetrapyrgos nigripes]|uniref:RING-type domain-containing protein n=1 Tax=Tetrapyrgos nigripes TaxID=182062 RepID=A0A8H5G3J4_9AGAR|nr:hypothetical protein D9758_007534 [Tetrapyrgos nigripes]